MFRCKSSRTTSTCILLDNGAGLPFCMRRFHTTASNELEGFQKCRHEAELTCYLYPDGTYTHPGAEILTGGSIREHNAGGRVSDYQMIRKGICQASFQPQQYRLTATRSCHSLSEQLASVSLPCCKHQKATCPG